MSDFSAYCKQDERVDDLQRNGLHILQKPDAFRFGMDAVLLSAFVKLRPRERVADMGCGTGILPLLLSQSEPTSTFVGFEWIAEMADMAARSVAMNGLDARIAIHAVDFREAARVIGFESMDSVVCNPPYGKLGSSLPSLSEGKLLARHETDCALCELAAACAAVLKNSGRLWMVFPAPRMLELFDSLRACRLEPKRVRMVCAKLSKPPYLVLIEAVKNARPALHWLPTLVVYDENGAETDELRALYHLPPR